MKILSTSDLHIGINLGDYDRKHDVEESIAAVMDLITEHKPNMFVFAGDMFHSNRNLTENVKPYLELLNFLSAHVDQSYLLVGNHDLVEQKGKTHAMDAGEEFENVHIVSTIESHHIGPEQYLMLVPHVSRSKSDISPEEQLASIPNCFVDYPESAKVYVFSHCNINAVDMGGQVLFKFNHHALPSEVINHPKVKYVFNGHFHKPVDGERLYIIGSPQRYTMDEKDDEKRVLLIDTDTDEVQSIPVPCRKMIEHNLDFISDFDATNNLYDLLMSEDYDANVCDFICKAVIKIKEEDMPKFDFKAFEARLNEIYGYVYKPHILMQREKRIRIKELTTKDDPEDAIEKFCKEYDQDRLIERAKTYTG